MVVLVTNDDGVDSRGLLSLVRSLRRTGREIVVAAPLRQNSGAGKSISFEVRAMGVILPDGTRGIGVTGTPADAVLLTLTTFLEETPELAVSGINLGPNLGLEDILSSGTVGAAMEAALHGIPAIASSLAAPSQEHYDRLTGEFQFVADLTADISKFVLDRGMPSGVDILNINFPLEPRGVALTKPCYCGYTDIYHMADGRYRMRPFSLDRYTCEEEDTDICLLKKGYITVVPLSLKGLCPGEVFSRDLEEIEVLLAEKLETYSNK